VMLLDIRVRMPRNIVPLRSNNAILKDLSVNLREKRGIMGLAVLREWSILLDNIICGENHFKQTPSHALECARKSVLESGLSEFEKEL